MPQVRNVNKKPAPPAAPEKQVITKDDVATVNASTLVNPPAAPMQTTPPATRPSGAIAVSVPSFLAQTEMPDTVDFNGSGYVGFASTRSKNWPAISAAGIPDGHPYLMRDKQYIPCYPLQFFLLRAEAFITLMVGEQGNLRYVSRDLATPGPTLGQQRSEPHYVGLLAVFTPNGLVPIKGDFRGTKSGGFESAITALKVAATPDWAKMSDAHRVSCAFSQPFGRVVTTITVQREISKSTGNPYYKSMGRVTPATIAEMEMLSKALQDETFVAELNEANANYEARLKFLDDTAARLANPQAAQAPR